MLRNFCLQIWPQPQFKTSRAFLGKFDNWRTMLKKRPLIRYDGIYRCKMRIFKDGLRWDSEYNPIFEMISYKYVRFLRSGQTMSLYTSHTPKKVMNKIKQTMIKSQVGLGNKVYESWSGELQLICGTFDMFNDRIIVTDPINATDYRYDF